MKNINKKEAQEIIEEYFSGNKTSSEKTKKIKRTAMGFRIRLGEYRKRFCKKCYSDLKSGRVRISKYYKKITCLKCGTLNKWKIK